MFKLSNGLLFAACILLIISETESVAQFGGRGGIFGGSSRGGRSDRGNSGQTQTNPMDRPTPDSYQQTQHRLMVLEVELHLDSQQQAPWQSFSQKVLAYASDFSRDRARAGVPDSEGTITGLQRIDAATAIARNRVTELEDIGSAAKALYATLSPDQKKIADKEILTIIAPGGPLGGDR